MQEDFHYYATYCAACMAGYTHRESLDICYSAQLVDLCSRTFLTKIHGPLSAATTQLQLELMDAGSDIISLQDITRIWASFHFLPYDLYAVKKRCVRRYLNKYRLICDVNGDLVCNTVELAKDRSLQAVGLAMHVLADTWAHRYFAGTPSLVINNTNDFFYELLPEKDGYRERHITFRHRPTAPDNIEKGLYTGTVVQSGENSVMSLGHGRAGHLPDYCFMRYKYMPAWDDYNIRVKDNPSDYLNAFCQMIYAMKYLRGEYTGFEKGCYDTDAVRPWIDEITGILNKRQPDASDDWRALGEKLSGCSVPAFDIGRYQSEYIICPEKKKNETFLGKFINAALRQKSMVTHEIFRSGNILAGISIDFKENGFKGIKDYRELIEDIKSGKGND